MSSIFNSKDCLLLDMLRDTPAYQQQVLVLPISKIEDIVGLVDGHSSHRVPMAVLYYHLLVVKDFSQDIQGIDNLKLLQPTLQEVVESTRIVDRQLSSSICG